MKSVSIVGYGRFGETLLKLMGKDFNIGAYTRSAKNRKRIPKGVKILTSTKDIYKADTIIYCVPISKFENVLAEHSPFIEDRHTVIDVLSVKVHPKSVFTNHLKNKKTQAILTHPMFGPDSSKNGFEGLPLIIDKFKSGNTTYVFWKNYFKKKKLKVVEMTPEEHDRAAADTQSLTHFVGRLLQEYGYKSTKIDSLGAKKLREIMEQVCNDSWELYFDLERYNPYTKNMVKKLDTAFERLHRKTFNS